MRNSEQLKLRATIQHNMVKVLLTTKVASYAGDFSRNDDNNCVATPL